MQKLSVVEAFADALSRIGRQFHWLAVAALPLLALHAYVVIEATPLMRIAFVNSFLKPADALQRGGYEIRMLEGFRIAPGPGYSFPVSLTVAVLVLEAVALLTYLLVAQRRLADGSFAHTRRSGSFTGILAICGWAGAIFAFAVLANHALTPIGRQIHAMPADMPVRIVLPGPRDILLGLAFGTIGGWLLLKAGLACLAVFQSAEHRQRLSPVRLLVADPGRTLGIVGLVGLVLIVVQVLPPMLEIALFTPGTVPLGFRDLHIFALSAFLLQFWLRLLVITAVITALWAYYRSAPVMIAR